MTALSDFPEFVPVVARWHFDEWGHDDPDSKPDSWAAALAQQADADQIPGTLVAVAGGTPVGAVCLAKADMPGYEPAARLSPWVKGMYVEQHARRRGYATLLMTRCESWAAALGHQVLHLYTERASEAEKLYLALGWEVFRQDQYGGMVVSVMRKPL